jgi:hypothetical protein
MIFMAIGFHLSSVIEADSKSLIMDSVGNYPRGYIRAWCAAPGVSTIVDAPYVTPVERQEREL